MARQNQAARWQRWMAEAQSGNADSYRLLLKEIAPFVLNVLSRRISRRDQAEDIVQEVLLSIHRARNTYSPERPFIPWLLAIVNYRRADYLRAHYSARDHVMAPLEDADFQNVTFDDHAGEYKDIENALGALTDRQRKVFDLVKIKGLTAKEAAEKTGMSVPAIKVSIHRSLQKLKEKLG